MRKSGVLLHITSLPSPDGIGNLGSEAYRFVDFLKAAGMRVWQMLPIAPTGYAESPYQCFSTFAGNPLFIDLKTLQKQGILKAEIDILPEISPDKVEFAPVMERQRRLLQAAFDASYAKYQKRVEAFRLERASWIEDYALFMALKEGFGGSSWQVWPDEELRMRKPRALEMARKRLQSRIDYHVFVQYLFFVQWTKLKSYANQNGIELFGDMPIYVAEDSADAWANPGVFLLDKQRRPIKVAGVPPDYFSRDGQRWGNPLYNWKALKRTGYRWWIDRLKAMGEWFDMVRVDHFIGFANYYAVPASEKTARNGHWELGPGKELFKRVKAELPDLKIIAEDLGAVNERVWRLMRYCAYPGMKVLSFAFSGYPDNEHLPRNHGTNAVVYTGTHDNNTLVGWWAGASDHDRNICRLVLQLSMRDDAMKAMVKAVFDSTADTAVLPMQDILLLPEAARMNTPGTIGGNWQWRMKKGAASPALAKTLRALNEASGRC